MQACKDVPSAAQDGVSEQDRLRPGQGVRNGVSAPGLPAAAERTLLIRACELAARGRGVVSPNPSAVPYTQLRAHETVLVLVCRLLPEKKKKKHKHKQTQHSLSREMLYIELFKYQLRFLLLAFLR